MEPLNDRVAYHSAKGRRPSNQDSVVVGVLADGRTLAAVADGMGGRLAGDVASRRALDVIVESLASGQPLDDAIRSANRAVFEESNANPDFHGMGTTVVALLQEGDHYQIANVGDSRAYRLAGDGISRLTADHSFTAEAVESGDMTPEDAVLSPWANALTRAIGTDPDVDVDVFGPFDARESHVVLLCSDGFHKPLTDEGILTSVLGCDPEEDSAGELAEVALQAGSDDNITIALVNFGDGSWVKEAVRSVSGDGGDDEPTIEFVKGAASPSDLAGASGAAEVEPVRDVEWALPQKEVSDSEEAGDAETATEDDGAEETPPGRADADQTEAQDDEIESEGDAVEETPALGSEAVEEDEATEELPVLAASPVEDDDATEESPVLAGSRVEDDEVTADHPVLAVNPAAGNEEAHADHEEAPADHEEAPAVLDSPVATEVAAAVPKAAPPRHHRQGEFKILLPQPRPRRRRRVKRWRKFVAPAVVLGAVVAIVVLLMRAL